MGTATWLPFDEPAAAKESKALQGFRVDELEVDLLVAVELLELLQLRSSKSSMAVRVQGSHPSSLVLWSQLSYREVDRRETRGERCGQRGFPRLASPRLSPASCLASVDQFVMSALQKPEAPLFSSALERSP